MTAASEPNANGAADATLFSTIVQKEEVAARRVVAFSSQNNSLACPTNANIASDFPGEYRAKPNPKADDQKEKPGALAGATGANLQSWTDWLNNNLNREASARALMQAILDCDPRDRIPLMERFIEALRAGQPIAAFDGVMAEAAFWADCASTAERKAYALAGYTRLSSADQSAFLNYVQRGAAA